MDESSDYLETGGYSVCHSLWSKILCRGDLKKCSQSLPKPERQTIGAGAEWPQLATCPQSPFSGPACCCDVAYLSQAFSQPASPGRLWISLAASLLLGPIGGANAPQNAKSKEI